MLVDYINKLCEQNHLDATLLKTKEEKIAALQLLPALKGTVFGSGSEAEKAGKSFCKLKNFRQLGPEDDVECYLATFERHCLSQDIPLKRWTLDLEACLTGKAQRAFSLLSAEQKENFEAVRDAILAAYRLTPEAYKDKFRTAQKLSSETFQQCATRLSLYLRRWFNPSERLLNEDEFQAIMGKLVVDQLIFSLNDESLRLKLLEHRWSTLEDFVSFADNLMIARLSHRGRASQRNNPTSPKRRQSPQSQTQLNQGSNSNAFRCFTCNEIGHLSYNCPNSPNGTLNFIRFSTEDCCEELVRFPNINTSTIPKLDGAYFEATVNGKVTLAYADSGSAKTFVNASEVELTDIIPLDSPLNLTFLDGTPLVVLGKVVFNLSIAAGVKDEAEAFVSDIPCPILLGRDLLAKLGLVFDISDNSYWAEKVRPRVKYPLLWIDRWGGPIQKGSSDTGLGLCLQKSLQSVSEVTDETGDDNET
ncbi:hypothetical protein HOLleu_43849 [Holothuria leucospilota]|uniref:CCHC-type domain-containing protein n=1 Tax=Holothuria leucospilota TaxID=206669 RepID=A0A9Q0YGI7_HOLLE|nr:hypothetical protein HOLleu_43849 [Holothuria leucospilota]